MGVGHKDLGRLHGHGAVCCFVPDGPEKMESKQHCIETTLRLQTGRNSQDSHVRCVPNANLDFVIFESRLFGKPTVSDIR